MRKLTAPMIARAAAMGFRSKFGERPAAVSVWNALDKYVSFYGVRSVVRTVFGSRIEVSTNARLENEIFYFGEWEPLTTRYLLERPKSNGIFVDIGANIGYYSLLASMRFRKVHAVEASPSIAERLRSNVKLNGAEDIISIHNFAAGEREGHIDFFLDSKHSGKSSVIRSDERRFEARVPVCRLEDYFSELDWSCVEFIKIDIEGSDLLALKSLYEVRRQLSPSVEILVEFEPHADATIVEKLWRQIRRFMDEDFSLYLIQGPIDRSEYVDRARRSKLAKLENMPANSCDVLLRRESATQKSV